MRGWRVEKEEEECITTIPETNSKPYQILGLSTFLKLGSVDSKFNPKFDA